MFVWQNVLNLGLLFWIELEMQMTCVLIIVQWYINNTQLLQSFALVFHHFSIMNSVCYALLTSCR